VTRPVPGTIMKAMIRVAVFVGVSAAFVLLTRRPFLAPRSHGFYRFFAFELLSGLVLLNVPYWFHEPFSVPQLASWVLLMVSAGLATEAFRLLLKVGKPAPGVGRDTDLWFEKTTMLVTTGIYRWIRHPMYASLIALGWGAFFKHPGWLGFGLAVGASSFLLATSVAEEQENLARFGAAYSSYLKVTKRFVPYVW
jgi:protein-S-isoprenylcysteine O-methyltransferase Ste14